MITVVAKDYCQNCPGFSPVSVTERIHPCTEPHLYRTAIDCKDALRCANIARYLEKEVEKRHEQTSNS